MHVYASTTGTREHPCEMKAGGGRTRANKLARAKCGWSPSVETLISEEALLLAKYLRNENSIWVPRIALLYTVARLKVE